MTSRPALGPRTSSSGVAAPDPSPADPNPSPSLSAEGTSQSTAAAREARPAVPPLACMRYSPRPCVNQALVDALKPLREWRFAEFGSAGSPEGISYSTAISAIIACPYKLRSGDEARQLFKVGEKLALKVDEFLETGRIKEADKLAHNERYQSLKSLMTVHGIGHHTAKELYAQGYRSAEDMRRSGKWEKEFRYHDDIQETIPRAEVESICRFVKLQLDRIERGAHIVIAGGYRRGKLHSNDVDLLITYPHEDGKERGMLRRLCHRLQVKGLIPPDGILSFSQPATLRSTRENKKAGSFDALDKALVVFRHPANGTTRPKDQYRRVDLIFARWPSFGAAVVGWSGSTQFERDLRKHAEKLGYKFDSGGLRVRGTNEVVPTVMERDVFRALKLKWIPPELRNADP
ncbi:hypothetical protein Rhopal_003272-T1 [Rhodotorula paludigena]|uniref:DNA polymerase n=1 Tax=Rhodotorula paludigena TaxID=86838 RepID=A0AAV5GCI1_9BASI|nr:hypothetical protein Rhopal_003272-T1 [Rhodotorula paludigena]